MVAGARPRSLFNPCICNTGSTADVSAEAVAVHSMMPFSRSQHVTPDRAIRSPPLRRRRRERWRKNASSCAVVIPSTEQPSRLSHPLNSVMRNVFFQ